MLSDAVVGVGRTSPYKSINSTHRRDERHNQRTVARSSRDSDHTPRVVGAGAVVTGIENGLSLESPGCGGRSSEKSSSEEGFEVENMLPRFD